MKNFFAICYHAEQKKRGWNAGQNNLWKSHVCAAKWQLCQWSKMLTFDKMNLSLEASRGSDTNYKKQQLDINYKN